MIPHLDQLEKRLADAYTQQTRYYDDALHLTAHSLESASADDTWVLELQDALQKVAMIEAVIADDKRDWQQSGQRPGESLRDILQVVADRIRLLTEQVDRCVAAVTERRHRLLPELDSFIRQRRMLHAYDQYNKPLEKPGSERAASI